MTEGYEYRGLIAQAWDLLRGDTSGWPDRAFYRGLIEQSGGPALDVGCGTGRLMLDYLTGGLDVDGVDNSPEMLAICRAKAAAMGIDVGSRLFEQAMEKLTLARRYKTIFVPSSSFQLLTDPAAADGAMSRFFEHLLPAGVLVMSIMSKLWHGKHPLKQMEWSDWIKMGEQREPNDGTIIRRWARARYDHIQQLEHEENRYDVFREGVIIQTELHSRSPAVRWYSQAQARTLFQNAGFTSVSLTSGFTFEPVSDKDTTFCVIGSRP